MALWPLLLITLGLWLLVRKWTLLRLGASLPELRDRFGSTYRLWLGPQLWVFLHSAEETRQALNDPTLRKAETFLQLEPLIGNGLLISHGAHWTRQRRLLTPAFQPQLLRSFAPQIGGHVDRLVSRLAEAKGGFLEVTDPLFACLLDAIVDTSMGAQLNTQLVAHSPIISAFHLSSKLLFKRMINPLLASDWIFHRTQLWRDLDEQLRVIHAQMEAVIEQRANEIEGREEGPGKACHLLDTLLLARFEGQALSRKEIRDEINTFVFAGVDTTTASMSFVLYALAKHPETQTRLRKELQDLPAEETSDPDKLNELPYLDAMIKEVLRMYTIVPTTGRQTTKATEIGGRTYCAGITLWINMYGLAHDKLYYPDPYAFKPERWLNDGDSAPPAFSYIPFSGGPHVCIGRRYSLLLMKLLTARLVMEFDLQLSPEQAPLKLQAQMVLKSQEGIHVAFVKRSNETC